MALLGNLTGSSQFFNPNNFYNGVATQSLRFDDGSSAYLTRTPDSASNRRTFTWSGWAKRANVGTAEFPLLAANTDANNRFFFRFEGNLIKLYYNVSGTANEVVTVALYRDTSAWYHVVLAVDTTQGTDTNRIKIYVNGVQQTLTGTYIAENTDTQINLDVAQLIGKKDTANTFYDGYLSEVNFIDGQALTPTSFGETKNGVWIPKKYSGSYGTNGFRLQFNQVGVGTASTSTIGADTSGNTHHFTSSGIVASDCNMPDSPENNFATLNAIEELSKATTFSEGNLQAVIPTAQATGKAFSTIAQSSGKWYWEIYYKSRTASGNFLTLGLQTTNASSNYYIRGADGERYDNGSTSSGTSARNAPTNVIGMAVDLDNGKWYIATNNTWQDAGNGTGDPEGGSGQVQSGLSGEFQLLAGNASSSGNHIFVANFGQDSSFAGNKTAQGNTDGNGIGDFYYAPPSGYLALCTSNLPEPTIGPNSLTQADDYFNTVLYTGSGSSPNAITGVGFQPDWVWIKKRSAAISHAIFDSSRGVTSAGATNKALGSDRTDAEGNGNGGLSAFGSDGFTLVDGTSGSYPRSLVNDSATYVAWNWKANGGTTTTNDASATGIGSIDSVIQANTDAGFSIVTYTGTGSAGTVAHGLGAVPKMLIVRNRSEAYNWKVYHAENTSAPATDYLVLDNTDATADNVTHWADTEPTSTVFSLGTSNALIKNTNTFVAYCFAEVEGYSKFGSYTGNGSTDGAFVFTGFRPAWLMIKRSNGTGAWNIADVKRSPENSVDEQVQANLTNAESTAFVFDFLSNGFKARTTDVARNGNGDSYVYMAFGDSFKYANAR